MSMSLASVANSMDDIHSVGSSRGRSSDSRSSHSRSSRHSKVKPNKVEVKNEIGQEYVDTKTNMVSTHYF